MKLAALLLIVAAITFSALTIAASAARMPNPMNGLSRTHVLRAHPNPMNGLRVRPLPHNFPRPPALAS